MKVAKIFANKSCKISQGNCEKLQKKSAKNCKIIQFLYVHSQRDLLLFGAEGVKKDSIQLCTFPGLLMHFGLELDVACPLLLSVCPGLFFCIFTFYVLTVVLLKCMGENFLLSEDEPLTPNIDGVMSL